MVSKVTVFSLLFALLLAAGIARWNVTHVDDCTRYLAGEKGFPPSQVITTGTRQVKMPCSIWLPRQSDAIQILCLLDLLLGVVFLLNALADIRKARAQRSAARQAAKAALPLASE
ncbi:MAG: hypothetical protein M3O02_00545 [Acidobacteriota bacterium]|nr:hypothetical protein [Acidobacteriota bacterium]